MAEMTKKMTVYDGWMDAYRSWLLDEEDEA